MATLAHAAPHCSSRLDDEEFSGSADAFTAELEQIEAAEGMAQQQQHQDSDADEHDDADDSGDLCDDEDEAASTTSSRVVPQLSFAALTSDPGAMRRCSMPGVGALPLAAAVSAVPGATKLKLTGAAGRVVKKPAAAPKAGVSGAKKAAGGLPAQGARPTRQQCQSVYAPSTSRSALQTSNSSLNLKQGGSHNAAAASKAGDQPLTARQVAKERAGIALSDLPSARGKENAGSAAHGKREVVVSVSRYMNSNRNTKNTCTIEKTVVPAPGQAAATSGAITTRRSSLHDGSISARTRSNAPTALPSQHSHATKRRSDAMDLVAHSGSNPAASSASSESEESPCKKAKLENTRMPMCSPVMESPEASVCAGSPLDCEMAARKLSFGSESPVATIAPIATAAAASAANAESDSVAHKTLLKVAAELAEKDAALSAALARESDLRAQLSLADERVSAARADTQSAMDLASETQAASQSNRERATAVQSELDAMRKKFDTLKAGVDKLSQERFHWRIQHQKLAATHELLKKHCAANGLALPVPPAGDDEWKSGSSVDFAPSVESMSAADLRRATFAASSFNARR